MTNLSIFTRFPSQGASSRYRFFMYIGKLMANNFNIETNSFFYPEYLDEFYSGKKISKLKILICYFSRICALLRSSKNLYIEYELFPKLPYFFESLFLRNKKYVLNYDDDVWDNYKSSKFLHTKYDSLVKNASGVVVANEYLYEKVKKLNQNVMKIPTVIDLDDYNGKYEKFERFSIVWIGTPVTYKFIESHSGIFQELAKKLDYELVIVAKMSLEEKKIANVNMRFYDWSPIDEVEILKRSHIGIMPLDNDSFSIGKSAFKLIQYQAAGLPSIATDIGENKNIIDAESGVLAGGANDWIDAVSRLASDKTLYDKMSIKAQENAYNFSIQLYAPKLIEFLKQSFKAAD